MTRFLPATLLAATLCGTAAAHAIEISDEIATRGIQGTITLLEQLSRQHTPDEQFALGGLHFLGAIEGALQARWQVGVSESLAFLPILRLTVPPNPTPAPLNPAFVTTLFTTVATNMDSARTPLLAIPPAADFALEINLADIWFDIDADGTRGAGEDAGAVLGPMLLGWQWDSRDPTTPLPVVRFDTADAAWLIAYTHLLHGISDTIIAYDPTAAITRVFDANAAMGPATAPNQHFDADTFVDAAATIIGALDQQPDTARLASAHAHFLQMIGANRRFWALVLSETDNAQEWLPNDAQQSALGITLPPGTGALWMGVLADGESLLNGKALIPYWRTTDARGINLKRIFLEPAPVDLVGWVQGYAAIPYLEPGRSISSQNWRSFEGMMAGDALLMTVFLN